MEKIADKQVITIEQHCLQLQYIHLRTQNPKLVTNLATSLEQYGQLVPIVIVESAVASQWVLIDGYHRVEALKRLGKDTIEAEVWTCTIPEALLMVLKNHSTRPAGIVEEALVLHEVYSQHHLSQQDLALRMGRNQSWISRRLSLIEHFPDDVLNHLLKGSIPLWTCVRVLAPMARAIPEHAKHLLTYLQKHTRSTREMQFFYEHYQKSHQQERARMIDDPELFFKAQGFLATQKHALVLKKGPEGQWQCQCQTFTSLLSDLILLAPQVFFRQSPQGCCQPLEEFTQVTNKFNELNNTIRILTDVNQRTTPNDSLPSP